MNADEKFRAILVKLLERSRRDEVNWQRSVPGDTAWFRGFAVVFPSSRIQLSFVSPVAESDYILVSVANQDNQTIREYCFYEGEDDWELVHELYREASRFALGWDDVLRDISKSIEEEGPVGLPSSVAP